MRSRTALLATLAIGAIVLVLPATAGADALVFNRSAGLECAFSPPGKIYRGGGDVR